jgi:hypothetical protein
MPKTPPVNEFDITVRHVLPDRLGALLEILAVAGYADIATNMVTTQLTFGQRTVHEVKSEDFLLEWMKDHPTFEARELIKHFRDNRRTDGAGYTAVRVLVEKGLLKKLGPGRYSRADIKAISPPKHLKASSPKHHKAKLQRDFFEVTHREFILRIARQNHGRFNVANMKERFKKDGRKPSSISGALGILVIKKKIKSMGDGEYVLLAKGGTKPKPEPEPKLKKPNGKTAESASTKTMPMTEMMEAAHG